MPPAVPPCSYRHDLDRRRQENHIRKSLQMLELVVQSVLLHAVSMGPTLLEQGKAKPLSFGTRCNLPVAKSVQLLEVNFGKTFFA